MRPPVTTRFAPALAFALAGGCGARTGLEAGVIDAGDAAADAAPPNVPCGLARGQTRTLASNIDPTALAIDDAHVYWYDHATQSILRVPKNGGATSVVASESHDVRFMAVDATDVYWTSSVQLSRTAKAGGGKVELLAPTEYSGGVAVDASNVYFAGAGAVVQQVAKGGGAVLTLADGQAQPMGVAVDGSWVYWVNGILSPQRGLLRAPIGGAGGPQAIGDAINGSHVALDDAFVYFTDQAGSAPEVVRAAKDGSGQTILFLDRQAASKPSGIGVDDTTLWWTDFASGSVYAAVKVSGLARIVAAGQSLTRELAVDAACVYWTTETENARDGTVVARGK